MLWLFEDALKSHYAALVAVLGAATREAPLEHFKKLALKRTYELLNAKPECEDVWSSLSLSSCVCRPLPGVVSSLASLGSCCCASSATSSATRRVRSPRKPSFSFTRCWRRIRAWLSPSPKRFVSCPSLAALPMHQRRRLIGAADRARRAGGQREQEHALLLGRLLRAAALLARRRAARRSSRLDVLAPLHGAVARQHRRSGCPRATRSRCALCRSHLSRQGRTLAALLTGINRALPFSEGVRSVAVEFFGARSQTSSRRQANTPQIVDHVGDLLHVASVRARSLRRKRV